MPEQKSELEEPESSDDDGAMEELADIVSGKKPQPPAWERGEPRRPARSRRLSIIALIIGLVSNVVVLPVLCLVGFGAGLKGAENNLTDDTIGESALIVAASLIPVGAGVVCSVIAMKRARAARRGDTLAMLALLLNLVPVAIGIPAVYGGAERVWTHNPKEMW